MNHFRITSSPRNWCQGNTFWSHDWCKSCRGNFFRIFHKTPGHDHTELQVHIFMPSVSEFPSFLQHLMSLDQTKLCDTGTIIISITFRWCSISIHTQANKTFCSRWTTRHTRASGRTRLTPSTCWGLKSSTLPTATVRTSKITPSSSPMATRTSTNVWRYQLPYR